MFKEFFFFELKYRSVRGATYAYFILIFLLSFFTVTGQTLKIAGAVGQTASNAPYVIALVTVVLAFVFTIITSAIVGVSMIRDYDHNMDEILFTTRLSRSGYLFGRFAGSIVIVILVQSAIWLGFMAGFGMGQYLPWEVSWGGKEILPFNAWHFIQPFLLFGVTNIFVTGSLFFMGGALGKNTLIIYMQGILLVILYQIGFNLIGDLGTEYWAALMDPFGVLTFVQVTKYWTPIEQNTLVVPMEGVMLYNRLLWIGIAMLSLAFTYFRFSFHKRRSSGSSFKKINEEAELLNTEWHALALPVIKQVINVKTHLQQVVKLSIDHFKMIWKEIPFIIIVGSGFLVIVSNAFRMSSVYGTSSYPTTASILILLNSFSLFFIIIIVFYSGELLWKERSSRMHLIVDALPVPTIVNLLSKFLALSMILFTLLLILNFGGILVQVVRRYYDFQWPAYFFTLYIEIFSTIILYTVMAFFIHLLVNNKYLGYTICIVLLILRSLMPQMGIENGLWQYASGSLEVFSDMNEFGHFSASFAWFKVYWSSLAALLLIIGIIFYPRGYSISFTQRWKSGKVRMTRVLFILALAFASIFVLSGFFVYYNISIINKFENSDSRKQWQANYERTLFNYRDAPQPVIVETWLEVELQPYSRDFIARGYYWLRNVSTDSISEIHVQISHYDHLSLDELTFEKMSSENDQFKAFGFYQYLLKNPLVPGDSMKMNFKVSLLTQGFVNEGKSNTDVVFNGSYITNEYLPSLGYRRQFELLNYDDRMDFGLTNPIYDSVGAQQEIDDVMENRIRFELKASTSVDQTLIAPGHLEKEWVETDRRNFHYKTENLIINSYSIVSGKYKVLRDRWKDTDLEIYYHSDHEYNTGRMMTAMADALQYNSENFGPYPYKELRIVEFPRYKAYAQTFASTIAFSEGGGFVLKKGNGKEDIDMTYYITVHEASHQWWEHRPASDNGPGSKMLSESLSQYAALMVMKKEFPSETLDTYLKYELDNYLKGRSGERGREEPLQSVNAGQGYIFNNKASLVFYLLQDFIGEDSLNEALGRFNQEWRLKGVYPQAGDLVKEIKSVTPDSVKYLINDLFESVTLFENKAGRAVYKILPNGSYELTMDVTCRKMKLDSVGKEKAVPINDWIDIGVFGSNSLGEDSLIYLKKHKFIAERKTIVISLNQLPVRAGIDPFHKFVDRHSNDNSVVPKRFIEVSNILLDF